MSAGRSERECPHHGGNHRRITPRWWEWRQQEHPKVYRERARDILHARPRGAKRTGRSREERTPECSLAPWVCGRWWRTVAVRRSSAARRGALHAWTRSPRPTRAPEMYPWWCEAPSRTTATSRRSGSEGIGRVQMQWKRTVPRGCITPRGGSNASASYLARAMNTSTYLHVAGIRPRFRCIHRKRRTRPQGHGIWTPSASGLSFVWYRCIFVTTGTWR